MSAFEGQVTIKVRRPWRQYTFYSPVLAFIAAAILGASLGNAQWYPVMV